MAPRHLLTSKKANFLHARNCANNLPIILATGAGNTGLRVIGQDPGRSVVALLASLQPYLALIF